MKGSFIWNYFQLFLLSETSKCLHDLKDLFPAFLAGEHSRFRFYDRYLSTFPCFWKGYYSTSSFIGRVCFLLKILIIFSCYFQYLFRNCRLAAYYLGQAKPKARAGKAHTLNRSWTRMGKGAGKWAASRRSCGAVALPGAATSRWGLGFADVPFETAQRPPGVKPRAAAGLSDAWGMGWSSCRGREDPQALLVYLPLGH